MAAWHEPAAYSQSGDKKAGGAEYRVYVEIQKPIPPIWSVILGEAIHNMRSALDQLVYQLYLDAQGKIRNGTAFPIFPSSDLFHKWGRDDIRGIGDGPKSIHQVASAVPESGTNASITRSGHSRDCGTKTSTDSSISGASASTGAM